MNLKLRLIIMGSFGAAGMVFAAILSDLPPILSHYLGLIFLSTVVIECVREMRILTAEANLKAPQIVQNDPQMVMKMDQVLESMATTQQAISFIIERAGFNKPKSTP